MPKLIMTLDVSTVTIIPSKVGLSVKNCKRKINDYKFAIVGIIYLLGQYLLRK